MSKRGVSGVITTVLLILIVLAAVGILWAVVSSFLKASTSSLSFTENLIGLDIIGQSAVYYENDDTISFKINRNSFSGNLSGLRVVVEGEDGNSESYDLLVFLDTLETKTFYFSLGGLVNNPQKISVLPLFSKNGKISPGSIKDSESLILSTSLTNFCGNGNVESGEECDDGNTDNTDGCSNDCKVISFIPQCSDGDDNDDDGLTDLADPGCADINDNDETDLPPPTSNLMFDIGANLESPDDWQRMNMFVDAIKSARYK
ncbi:DUF4215 domain-containing protein, partial [Candidatus Pacearchaeota archaeon]|nr:DUF4215 domain-containing protein [Candidatus Pacearchaeota archaeon]